jgi:hypothetical protein
VFCSFRGRNRRADHASRDCDVSLGAELDEIVASPSAGKASQRRTIAHRSRRAMAQMTLKEGAFEHSVARREPGDARVGSM